MWRHRSGQLSKLEIAVVTENFVVFFTDSVRGVVGGVVGVGGFVVIINIIILITMVYAKRCVYKVRKEHILLFMHIYVIPPLQKYYTTVCKVFADKTILLTTFSPTILCPYQLVQYTHDSSPANTLAVL